MKVLIGFALVIVVVTMIVPLTACRSRAQNNPQVQTRNLNMENYWRYVNVVVVDMPNDGGYRLQFHSEIEGATFENVIIGYSIVVDGETENWTILLAPNGAGNTRISTDTPIIRMIIGRVEWRT